MCVQGPWPRGKLRALMSSLNAEQLLLHPWVAHFVVAQKRYDKSVTMDTFHRPIGPYAAIAASRSSHHASRATRSSARSAKMGTAASMRSPRMCTRALLDTTQKSRHAVQSAVAQSSAAGATRRGRPFGEPACLQAVNHTLKSRRAKNDRINHE